MRLPVLPGGFVKAVGLFLYVLLLYASNANLDAGREFETDATLFFMLADTTSRLELEAFMEPTISWSFFR